MPVSLLIDCKSSRLEKQTFGSIQLHVCSKEENPFWSPEWESFFVTQVLKGLGKSLEIQ